MAMLWKLLQLGVTDRQVHLYDTFSGMTEPSECDVDCFGRKASDIFEQVKCEASLEEVRRNVASVGYPMHLVHFHVGDVRRVSRADVPSSIALLRLVCDWYELVRTSLEMFEPHVVTGGVVTNDDAGFWKGARKAQDEYLKSKSSGAVVHHIDDTGEFWVVRR